MFAKHNNKVSILFNEFSPKIHSLNKGDIVYIPHEDEIVVVKNMFIDSGETQVRMTNGSVYSLKFITGKMFNLPDITKKSVLDLLNLSPYFDINILPTHDIRDTLDKAYYDIIWGHYRFIIGDDGTIIEPNENWAKIDEFNIQGGLDLYFYKRSHIDIR